jgi:glucose uptake protein
MFIVSNYSLAIIFTFITMLCWGSWANTQKLAAKTWRFELYYWDYVIGIVLFALLAAFTLGSFGELGRGFISDIQQADPHAIWNAFLGGIIFNLANILLVAAIAIAGMSVAFPLGIGIALILGVVVNYIGAPKGDPLLLFAGVAMVAVAIVLDAMAYSKKSKDKQKVTTKGILLSVVAGLLMSLFYRFVAISMSGNFEYPEAGRLTPYTALVIFALGILVSNLLFNTVLMRKPIEGEPVHYKTYFGEGFKTHLTGILGGLIWALGMLFNIIAAGKAGYAISYGLGQGATLVGALWGVFIWKEFEGASKTVNIMLVFMFLLFMSGIGMIILAGI